MFLICSKAHITTWERIQIPLHEWGQCPGSKKQLTATILFFFFFKLDIYYVPAPVLSAGETALN